MLHILHVHICRLTRLNCTPMHTKNQEASSISCQQQGSPS